MILEDLPDSFYKYLVGKQIQLALAIWMLRTPAIRERGWVNVIVCLFVHFAKKIIIFVLSDCPNFTAVRVEFYDS